MQIKNYKQINKGALIATFIIETDVFDKTGAKRGIQKAECAYFEKNDSYWLNSCAKLYETKEGAKKSYNMLSWDSELTKQITRAVREKIHKGDYELREERPAKVIEDFKEEDLPF
jgi:hypothetical protein